MAINIQPIIDEIISRLALADSSDVTSDQIRLEKLVKNATATSGVLEYGAVNQLPDIDSSTIGSIVYVTDTKYDKYGTFYAALNTGWERITLATDSDEDSYRIIGVYPGNAYGYTSGGNSAPIIVDTISKFSFTSDGNATNVGTLTAQAWNVGAVSSKTNAYVLMGSIINKFPFATEGASTSIGTRIASTNSTNQPGNSSIAYDAGYSTGGTPNVTSIEKVSFTVDGNSTNVGSLTVGRGYFMGQSSQEHGYSSGALDPVALTQRIIDKFPFANEGNATDVGDLTEPMSTGAGQSSITHGYATGNTRNTDKFPFSSDVNATSIGDIFSTLDGSLFQYPAGHSSIDYGYISGGLKPTRVNHIEKFPFTSETASTNVGDLVQVMAYHGGHHV